MNDRPQSSVFFAGIFLLSLLLSSLLLPACSSEKEKKLAVGDSAPEFSLKSLAGETLNLAEMKGSPVLLRFFLTDCKYCRADTPVFNDFHTKYKDKGLKVLYIDSLGIQPKTVKTFVKELGILFPVAQDKGGEVTKKYRVRALPQTIVLDPEHKIKAAILGGISEEELGRLLAPYLDN
jgi:peroxiredoxin